jgi:hypothetical protein
MVTPRLTPSREVTLTTATAGADSSAQGAQVRFVTAGTNTLRAPRMSIAANPQYEHVLQPAERPAAAARRSTRFGASIGARSIPKVVDGRGKAFFFNEEMSWTPNQVARADDPAADRTRRHVPLQHGESDVGERIAAGRGERTDPRMDPTGSALQAIDREQIHRDDQRHGDQPEHDHVQLPGERRLDAQLADHAG